MVTPLQIFGKYIELTTENFSSDIMAFGVISTQSACLEEK